MRYRVVKTILLPVLFTFLILQGSAEARNYVILSVTKDGLRELRLAYRGRLFLETSLSTNSSLIFQRATDGIRLVETVIRHNFIDDCIVKSSSKDVLSFVRQFSRKTPREFLNSEEEIMDVYLGIKNFSDVLMTRNHVHVDTPDNKTVTENDGLSDQHLFLKQPSEFKLSAKVSSGRRSLFLRLFKRHLRIRQKSRECEEFYDEATKRLRVSTSQSAILEGYHDSSSQMPLNTSENDDQIHHRHRDHRRHRHRSRSHHHGRHEKYTNEKLSSNGSEGREHVQTMSASSSRDNITSNIAARREEDVQNNVNTSTTGTDLTPDTGRRQLTTTQAANQELSPSSLSLTSSPSNITRIPNISQKSTQGVELQTSDNDFIYKNNTYTHTHKPRVSVIDDGEDVTFDDELLTQHTTNLTSELGERHSRSRRDLLTGWVIFPGTKWCGDGDIAEHKKDLGYHVELDSCCRRHDLCPLVIPRLTWKYGMFNYRLHTLSHCRCDRKFRKCLQKSASPLAHLIGQIYFNVVGPQCFKFTQQTTCVQRLWWGGCTKYATTKVAYPKRQRRFK